jgi:hypothetical protein
VFPVCIRFLKCKKPKRREEHFFWFIFPSASVWVEDVKGEIVEAAGDAEAADVNGVVDCLGT